MQSSIEVTDEGIVISVKDEHSLKEDSPNEVTEEGIAICFNDSHSLKKDSLIKTIEGIVT